MGVHIMQVNPNAFMTNLFGVLDISKIEGTFIYYLTKTLQYYKVLKGSIEIDMASKKG